MGGRPTMLFLGGFRQACDSFGWQSLEDNSKLSFSWEQWRAKQQQIKQRRTHELTERWVDEIFKN